MSPQPGEIHLVDLGMIGKVRPAVIVSRKDQSAPRVLAPLCRHSSLARAYPARFRRPAMLKMTDCPFGRPAVATVGSRKGEEHEERREDPHCWCQGRLLDLIQSPVRPVLSTACFLLFLGVTAPCFLRC